MIDLSFSVVITYEISGKDESLVVNEF